MNPPPPPPPPPRAPPPPPPPPPPSSSSSSRSVKTNNHTINNGDFTEIQLIVSRFSLSFVDFSVNFSNSSSCPRSQAPPPTLFLERETPIYRSRGNSLRSTENSSFIDSRDIRYKKGTKGGCCF